ncbi:hypothetical protein BUALT_Bualt09G0130900 [Buddleja alternifolia]|uniref:Macrophage migration inhibitory factor n=1 Tax=Buddleja alternifolia TaxID=168488 RepID=A0AAV6X9K9_9LAMI|nr:hypothetical protein BUALT_Bualt09G0130900 [Buddleja alternifolia]
MPCLNLSTNVSLEGIDTYAILSEASSTVAKLIGKPEALKPDIVYGDDFMHLLCNLAFMLLVKFSCGNSWLRFDIGFLMWGFLKAHALRNIFQRRYYVMIVLKGSVPMAFGGTEQPAAYGELVSIGGLNSDVNKKLSGAIANILETKLSVPKSRFYLKFYDTKGSNFGWNGSTF